jgi:type VI secretion system protein ImpM
VVVPLSIDAVTDAMIFGKLPFHGDFVARGISSSERAELDRWLSRSMAEARDHLGERFGDSFDAAAPWLFAWRDERWTAGAMAPSVDSAGRRFPVMAGLRGLDKALASAAAEQCEEALFKAVSNCWSVEQLEEQLSTAVVAPTSSEVEEGWWPKEADRARLPQRLPRAILRHVIEAGIRA